MRQPRILQAAILLATMLAATGAPAGTLATHAVRTDASQRVRCVATNLGSVQKMVRIQLFRGAVDVNGPNFLVSPASSIANLDVGGGFVRCVLTIAGPARDFRGALLVQDASDRTVLSVDAR